jgi:tetratricopeptide (TPR) repeat protein
MKLPGLLIIPLFFAACTGNGGQTAETQADADSALYAPMILPLTDSIKQFPDNADLHFRRALLLYNTDPALAQKDFEKAAHLKPKVADYWAGAGEAALLVEDYKHSVANFQEALRLQPTYSYLQYRLATAMIENKQYKQADSLATVLAAHGETHDKGYYLKARIAEERKDTALAIRDLTTAVDAAGMQSDYDAVMELGDLLAARRTPSAVQYYQLAARLDSSTGDPLYSMAQFYEQDNNIPAAVQSYKICISIDPDYEQAYIQLGKICFKQQQWQPAFNYFNLAAKSDPTDAEAYYYRGRCHEKLGHKDAAFDDYVKAISFRKNYPEAQQALDQIRKK